MQCNYLSKNEQNNLKKKKPKLQYPKKNANP